MHVLADAVSSQDPQDRQFAFEVPKNKIFVFFCFFLFIFYLLYLFILCLKRPSNNTFIQRLRQSGAFITTSESALFMLLQSKDHPHFKAVSQALRDRREALKTEDLGSAAKTQQ